MNFIKKYFNKVDDKSYRNSKYTEVLDYYIHELEVALETTDYSIIEKYAISLAKEYVNKGSCTPLYQHSVVVAPYAITDKTETVKVAHYRCLKCRAYHNTVIDLKTIWKKRVPLDAFIINRQCEGYDCKEMITIKLNELHKFLR